jgi:glycosyltransferase involved in cell wall biosynthesis
VLTAHLGDVPGGVPEKTRDWFRWIFPFTRFVWRDASARVAVSEFTRGLALQHYKEEILVIPNGVDVNLAESLEIHTNNPPVIAFAGRFMEQKSPLGVVEVLNEINDIPWKCVMIGDGPLLEHVKHSISRYGLEDRFVLTGWIAPEEVMEWFGQSDILFMPSLSEGLPVVGVQALSKGLAIVASRVGGFVDLVDEDRNGHLLEPGDIAGFAAKLQGLLKNPDHLLSLRKHSLQKAKSFEITQIAVKYESLFQEILMQRKGSIHLKGSK